MNRLKKRWIGDLLRDTSGIDQHVEVAESSDNILNGSAHSAVGADVDLVVDDVTAGLLVELLGDTVAELLVDVKEGQVLDTGLGQCLSHVVAETASTAMKVVSEGELAISEVTYPVTMAVLPVRVKLFMVRLS